MVFPLHVNPDGVLLFEEVPKDRREDVCRGDGARADADVPGQGRPLPFKALAGILEKAENAAGAVVENLPFGGGRKKAALAVHDLRPRFLLQVADVLRQRGLGHEHFLRRLAEAPVLHQEDEPFELLQGHVFQFPFHGKRE